MSMTPVAAASFVESFNQVNPIGTPIILIKDRGEKIETKTKSEAFVDDNHYPMIMIDGISGSYSLNRVVVNRKANDHE